MADDADVLRLYHYFLWADEMRRCFRGGSWPHQTATSEMAREVSQQHYLYTWLGALHAVVEGWQELELSDRDPMLADWLTRKTGRTVENGEGKGVEETYVMVLRRARNKVFHFERRFYPEQVRVFHDVGARWANSLHDLLTVFFQAKFGRVR